MSLLLLRPPIGERSFTPDTWSLWSVPHPEAGPGQASVWVFAELTKGLRQGTGRPGAELRRPLALPRGTWGQGLGLSQAPPGEDGNHHSTGLRGGLTSLAAAWAGHVVLLPHGAWLSGPSSMAWPVVKRDRKGAGAPISGQPLSPGCMPSRDWFAEAVALGATLHAAPGLRHRPRAPPRLPFGASSSGTFNLMLPGPLQRPHLTQRPLPTWDKDRGPWLG